jgi:hypothetical protein
VSCPRFRAFTTSYLFTNGPFQNAGVKANYAISDKVGQYGWFFNDAWNSYKADPIKGLNAFRLNYLLLCSRNKCLS